MGSLLHSYLAEVICELVDDSLDVALADEAAIDPVDLGENILEVGTAQFLQIGLHSSS